MNNQEIKVRFMDRMIIQEPVRFFPFFDKKLIIFTFKSRSKKTIILRKYLFSLLNKTGLTKQVFVGSIRWTLNPPLNFCNPSGIGSKGNDNLTVVLEARKKGQKEKG